MKHTDLMMRVMGSERNMSVIIQKRHEKERLTSLDFAVRFTGEKKSAHRQEEKR
jgi:hypothetical protein